MQNPSQRLLLAAVSHCQSILLLFSPFSTASTNLLSPLPSPVQRNNHGLAVFVDIFPETPEIGKAWPWQLKVAENSGEDTYFEVHVLRMGGKRVGKPQVLNVLSPWCRHFFYLSIRCTYGALWVWRNSEAVASIALCVLSATMTESSTAEEKR